MPPAKKTAAPVIIKREPTPETMAEALKLAGGDRARLKPLDDGSVLITNHRRVANRPVR